MSIVFKCSLCNVDNDEVEVSIQRCGHILCWKCLGEYIPKNLAPKVKCPVKNCGKFLSDAVTRKTLCDEDIKIYEQLSMGRIERKINCMLPGCDFVFTSTERDLRFECSKCTMFNCVTCKAAHRSLKCPEFQSRVDANAICQREINRASEKLIAKNKERCRNMFLEIENTNLLLLANLLECPNCTRNLSRGDGVVLRCSHVFCRFCLKEHVMNTAAIPIICLTRGCEAPLYEREIAELLTENEMTIYIDRCCQSVKGKLELTFQCQKPDCTYFATYSMIPPIILCPVCSSDNCTKCFAIHSNETCQQFKERIKSTPYGKTLLVVEEKIRKKEWMRCMKCHMVLEKMKGCSWIQCSNCKFEMCWATKMRRWGPKGRGDESDGCKCQLRGKKCAPDCGTCEPHADGAHEMPIHPVRLEVLGFLREMGIIRSSRR